MPEQPRVIAEFKECWNCHHTETLTQIATKEMKEAGRLPKEVFTSLSKQIVPLTDPRVALSVETLLVLYDVCAKCGITRCTRAEVVTGMVQMRGVPKPPQAPFSPS